MRTNIDWETTMANTDRAFDIIAIVVGIILGLAMIGQGAYKLYNGINDGADPLFYIGHTITVLGGISVIILSPMNRIKMTGAYAMTLGMSRFCLRWNDICATSDPRVIFVELIFVVLAANFVRVGIYYARGKVVSQLSMTITASILVGTDILLIVVDQYAEELLRFVPFGIDSNFYVMNALMYAALIGLLDTKIIRENTELAKHAKVLDRVRSAYALGEDSYITEETAKCLLERSGPLWKDVNDGTVRSEMAFTIIHHELEASAIAQVWEGKDPIYLTIVDEGDSVFNANRFRIDDLTESDGMLFGYGKDGTRFKIIVKAGDEE